MTQQAEHIAQLISRYLTDELTAAERLELDEWLKSASRHKELFNELADADKLTALLQEKGKYDKLRMKSLLREEFPQIPVNEPEAYENTDIPVSGRRFLLARLWWAAAAVILLIIGTIAYRFISTSVPEKKLAQTVTPVNILPGSDRAILTLSNGQKVELNSATSETIQDGTLSIGNNNGQLIYKKGDMVVMNTMSTPRGGQYQLTLSDGTRVWLNAASSITYPTSFKEKTRTVTISGEAYFEVTANKSQPFIVKTIKEEITVLGTSFNVNAYEDEPTTKTSLIEGSIKINNAILTPGKAYTNHKIINTNIDQDIAWKNGAFGFDNTELEKALRQIARWYDIEIVYPDGVPNEFIKGDIGRNLTLNQAVKVLKDIGVNCRIEGRKLVVLR
ncbi:MAG: FecR family protein [Chitinophagaceae bacterium]|nr:FecR family protein [Chitinophagaceae bacterium]